MRTEVIKVAGETGVEKAAARAAAALVQGKLVGFPTETVYGIAAIAAIPEAMEGLRDLKSRPRMPFSVHLGRAEEVERYVSEIPQAARRVINKAWPGPLTILLPTGGRLADMALQVAGLHDVLCWEDTIGLRCPRPAVTRQMLIASEHPVVATSANPAGQPSPRAPAKVLEYFDGRIDMLIDAGQTDLGRDSTIVKFGATGWDVVREGAVDRSILVGLVRRKVVFVCTGNTCRSPLAEGLARKFLAERAGVGPDELGRAGLEVVSAGVYAADGQPPMPEAIQAAGLMGADISRHRSQKLTAELIKSSDLVLCMTDMHLEVARRLGDGTLAEIRKLDPSSDVPDPIGGGVEQYIQTSQRLRSVIEGLMRKGRL